MEKRLVPEIRFKGFKGDWEEKRFRDISTVKSCKRIYKQETFEDEEIPFYKIGTFGASPDAFITRTKYEEYKNKYSFPKYGDILISASGTLGRTIEYKGEEAYFQDSNIVWLDINEDEIKNKFLKHLYSVIRWNSEGSTIKRLYNDNILSTKIKTPRIDEQEKIGRLFESLDQIIDLQGKVVEENKRLKGALLQKLFPKKGQKLPELRLKGFSGEWKEKKLGDILTEVVEKSTENNQYEILSSTTSGLYLQKEYFKNQIASTDNTGYKILRLNQIVLSPQNLWMGNININDKYEIGLVSPSYKIFDINEDYDKTFVSKILNTKRAYYEYEVNSEQGASIVRKNLNMNNFLKIKFKVPSLPEQEAIGHLFKVLDEKIAREEERLEGYKTLKKSLLQKMFV